MGDRSLRTARQSLGPPGSTRGHQVDVVAALAGAGQHGAQALVQTRVVGSTAPDPGFLLVAVSHAAKATPNGGE